MKFEQPPLPSSEEMAKIEKQRALSDAELLKRGAEYKFDEKGEKRLEVTDEQIEEVKKEIERDLEKTGELKSTKEIITEQLSQEGIKLQEKKDIEQKKIIEDFEKSLNELQKDINQGNIIYRIDTPIAPLNIKNKEADIILAGEKVKNYQMYGYGIRNCSKDQLNRRDGGNINRSGLSYQFEPRIYEDIMNDKEKNEFLRKANASISLTTVKKVSEYHEKKQQKKLDRFFKEAETIKVRKEGEEAKIKDLTEKSFIGDKDPEEKIFHLNITYQNEVYPKDSCGIGEKNEEERILRRNISRISFYIGEKEADNILAGIRIDQRKFWEIINRIEPNLLNIVPPRQESFYGARALLVKIQGKEDEILQWPLEKEKRVVEKPIPPPELPPSARKIPDEIWQRNFFEVRERTKNLLRDKYGDWIEIGKRGIKTQYGIINGPLIYVDDEFLFAIFDTPEGKFKVPINELLDPFGISYGEKNERKEKNNRPPLEDEARDLEEEKNFHR